ncbi:unnamed protein product [Euphydryas editha]|uniref:Uncharacterized protein n=1 Tax=Euphydryas editha TaxID=104508 RepID=A0AAU9VFY0_EUPED|nr:unnamed protein product [Euphydryas editha]
MSGRFFPAQHTSSRKAQAPPMPYTARLNINTIYTSIGPVQNRVDSVTLPSQSSISSRASTDMARSWPHSSRSDGKALPLYSYTSQ